MNGFSSSLNGLSGALGFGDFTGKLGTTIVRNSMTDFAPTDHLKISSFAKFGADADFCPLSAANALGSNVTERAKTDFIGFATSSNMNFGANPRNGALRALGLLNSSFGMKANDSALRAAGLMNTSFETKANDSALRAAGMMGSSFGMKASGSASRAAGLMNTSFETKANDSALRATGLMNTSFETKANDSAFRAAGMMNTSFETKANDSTLRAAGMMSSNFGMKASDSALRAAGLMNTSFGMKASDSALRAAGMMSSSFGMNTHDGALRAAEMTGSSFGMKASDSALRVAGMMGSSFQMNTHDSALRVAGMMGSSFGMKAHDALRAAGIPNRTPDMSRKQKRRLVSDWQEYWEEVEPIERAVDDGDHFAGAIADPANFPLLETNDLNLITNVDPAERKIATASEIAVEIRRFIEDLGEYRSQENATLREYVARFLTKQRSAWPFIILVGQPFLTDWLKSLWASVVHLFRGL
jgi:hypothetical protein